MALCPLLFLPFVFCLVNAQTPPQTVSGVPYNRGGVSDNFSRRIEYMIITVSDMSLALEWYTTVLGGVLLQFCNEQNQEWCVTGEEQGVVYYGDQHMNAMFEAELEDGLRSSLPDISDNGDYQVLSNFVAYGNGLVQLIKFENRNTKEVFNLREPRTSPCWVGAGHMCMWMTDYLDMNYYIAIAEKDAAIRQMSNVQWNRPIPQQNRTDRKNCPVSQYANKETEGAFEGLEWSYYKGPIAEQLEMYKMVGTIKQGVGASYCARGAVSLAYVNGTRAAQPKKRSSPVDVPADLYGIFQFGYRTDNLHGAVGFYTEVMGGDLIPYPTEGLDIRGDSAHWMLMANETIEAIELSNQLDISQNEAERELGVLNISDGSLGRLDHRFILFDNFVVEALLYTDGLSFGGKPFNPTWEHLPSPAYIGSVGGAFGIPDNISNLTSALPLLRQRAFERGYGARPVFIPHMPAAFPESHPYSGLEYAFGKGQSSEVLNFVDIEGYFQDILRMTLEENGFVSTMFNSTNVFLNGDMDEFCSSVGY